MTDFLLMAAAAFAGVVVFFALLWFIEWLNEIIWQFWR